MSQVTSEKGIALVIVLSITGILAAFGIILLRSSSIQYQQTEQSKAKERALFYAEAGIEEARWYILERGTNWLKSKADTTDNLFHLGFEHTMDSSQGNVRVEVKNIDDIAGQDLYTISSVGTYFIGGKSIRRKIVATAAAVKQSSMSDLSFFVGNDDQKVDGSWNVFGPVHINKDMIFKEKYARFHDKVTVTGNYSGQGSELTAGATGSVVYDSWGLFDDINPADGIVDIPPLDGQARINPVASNFDQCRYKAISGGIYSTGILIVDFFEEDSPGLGGYIILNDNPAQKYYLNELSQKAIYSDTCRVKGTLQGQITVAATDIYISGNILYSQLEPPSNEPYMMGLMAKRDILIPRDIDSTLDFIDANGEGTPTEPEHDSITGDLIISAALYAGSEIRFKPKTDIPKKGTLVINGSMASNLSTDLKRTGSGKGFTEIFYNYDNNFKLFSPPNFILYSPPCIWNWHEEGI